MGKNVLVLGSGGREHALSWKISQSPDCSALYVAPGNPGTATFAQNLEMGVNDFEKIRDNIRALGIDLLVVGPEDPLVKGVRDYLQQFDDLKNLPIVGPGSAGARLEGSKDFSKDFMERHGACVYKIIIDISNFKLTTI